MWRETAILGWFLKIDSKSHFILMESFLAPPSTILFYWIWDYFVCSIIFTLCQSQIFYYFLVSGTISKEDMFDLKVTAELDAINVVL